MGEAIIRKLACGCRGFRVAVTTDDRPIYSTTTIKRSALVFESMSEKQPRSEGGEFGEKVTEQDILKVFDAASDPFLTAGEVADRLPISRQAVHHRLEKLREDGRVDKKKTGARGAGWWATVAPRLDADVAERAAAADREDAIALDDLKSEFDTA